MKIIDISWPITEDMTEYKDRRSVSVKTLSIDDPYVHESIFCFKSHVGTHIDAPKHFIKGGKALDQLQLDATIGQCQVIDMMQVEDKITQQDVASISIQAPIVLFKTKNSLLKVTDPFKVNFVYVASDAAEYLVAQNIKAVGIDYLGIERNQPDHETHKAFLSHDIPIIEGLRLEHVEPGLYQLFCLPLRIMNVDASPARAVLYSE